MSDEVDGCAERTHYHFSISLRVRHPNVDPMNITEHLGIQPTHFGKAGEGRRTPRGSILSGVNRESYWTARVSSGRWPLEISSAICDVLNGLLPHRSYLHTIRNGGGNIELFIGWFFENQSGDVLNYKCLALAGDLKIDLSFDIYPPDQPQSEHATFTEPPVQNY